jgi:hypothetical protein
MHLYVPEVRDLLELEESWTFDLYEEYRNEYLMNFFGFSDAQNNYYVPNPRVWKVTLPATTKLKVARIYIRNGMSEYSSLTFTIVETPLQSAGLAKRKGVRAGFWAKLADVNNMHVKRPEGR